MMKNVRKITTIELEEELVEVEDNLRADKRKDKISYSLFKEFRAYQAALREELELRQAIL